MSICAAIRRWMNNAWKSRLQGTAVLVMDTRLKIRVLLPIPNKKRMLLNIGIHMPDLQAVSGKDVLFKIVRCLLRSSG
jgi:hypothetical protein